MRRLAAGPAVMGIVNVTPDSFSDGGLFADPGRAVEHALRLAEEGASALDLGAESTRPGAAPVPPGDERERLLPVLKALRAQVDLPLSIDTRNACTAAAALDEGADLINDVSGLRHDARMASLLARTGAGAILMHSRGTPADMVRHATYDDVVADVRRELGACLDRALEAGVEPERVVLDPGFGFAKTAAQSAELLARLGELLALGRPLLVGLSRKSFLGPLVRDAEGAAPPARRLHASVGAALAAVSRGATWLRVHDVRETVEALAGFLAGRSPAPT